jgi:hypothetical protein
MFSCVVSRLCQGWVPIGIVALHIVDCFSMTYKVNKWRHVSAKKKKLDESVGCRRYYVRIG